MEIYMFMTSSHKSRSRRTFVLLYFNAYIEQAEGDSLMRFKHDVVIYHSH
jgi:hypothetical protein